MVVGLEHAILIWSCSEEMEVRVSLNLIGKYGLGFWVCILFFFIFFDKQLGVFI